MSLACAPLTMAIPLYHFLPWPFNLTKPPAVPQRQSQNPSLELAPDTNRLLHEPDGISVTRYWPYVSSNRLQAIDPMKFE